MFNLLGGRKKRSTGPAPHTKPASVRRTSSAEDVNEMFKIPDIKDCDVAKEFADMMNEVGGTTSPNEDVQLEGMTPEDLGFSQEDLNDPQVRKTLLEMGVTGIALGASPQEPVAPTNRTPLPYAKQQESALNPHAVTPYTDGDIDSVGLANVQLSEADMNDPELLAQLQSIGWKETQNTPAVMATAANAEQERAQKLSAMKEEANVLKLQALAAKKKGDLKTAKTLYLDFKRMNAAIEKLKTT